MNIFLIISGVFFGLLALGFLVGFIRNWCRSLIRLGILVGDFLISLFISPLVSNLLIGKIVSGSKISIAGTTIDINDYLTQIFGNDLNGVGDTTSAMSVALANVLLNIIIFIAMFLIIALLSLIVYYIVLLVLKKTRGKAESPAQPNGKTIGLRLLGGFEGMVSMIVLVFAMLVPFFGTFEILDSVISNSDTTTQNSASAFSGANLVCGELYYTEDTKIGNIEGYLENYSILRKKYDSTIMGRVYKILGLNKLGSLSFNKLSNVNVDGEKVEFSKEISTVVEVYGEYKECFVKNSFNINNDNSIDVIQSMYKTATKSKFVKDYVVDLIPTMAEKWSNNETFLNIENPVPEEYKKIFIDSLKVFSSSQNFTIVDENINALFDVAKTAKEYGVIKALTDGEKMMDILKDKDGFVKQVILNLTQTAEFQNNLPQIMSDGLEILYNSLVGDEKYDGTIPTVWENKIDWEKEAETLNGIPSTLLKVYEDLENKEEGASDEEVISSNLGKIGKVIDLSRDSQTIELPLKSFIIGFISSDNINFGENDESLKTTMVNYINEKWDKTENPDFSFEKTFGALGTTALVAERLSSGKDIDFELFKNAMQDISSDDDAKAFLGEIVSTGLIYDMVGISNESYLLSNLLDTYITTSSVETISADLDATKSLLDIITLPSDTTLTDDDAKQMAENIAGSKAILDMTLEIAEDAGRPLSELTKNLSEDNKNAIIASIGGLENLDENEKLTLVSIFA